MKTELYHAYLRKRLKEIHLGGIIVMLLFFSLIFYLGEQTAIPLTYAQIILLVMAGLITASYITLLPDSEKEPFFPLVLLFFLNLLASALIWSTGIFHSPFVVLYIILIIITAQLYGYTWGLLQALVALFGFVTIYGITSAAIVPYYSLLPFADRSILFQQPAVILVHGLLYAFLFLFTVVSSSRAQITLFRPLKKIDIDTTYQEKIILEMPLAVLIVDNNLTILAQNPAAANHFPVRLGGQLFQYLSVSEKDAQDILKKLAASGEKREVTWKTESGKRVQANISAHLLKGHTQEAGTYVLFLQ